MGVTTQHHQHNDFTAAADRWLATELDVIARRAAFDADRHRKNATALFAEHRAHPHASDLLIQAQATRDTGLERRAVADRAQMLIAQLRRDPGDVTLDDRAGMLTWLAQQSNARQIDDEQLAGLVAGWAPDVDANQRESLFDDLCEAVKDRDGLETGDIDWRTMPVASGIGGRDRALDLANGRVDAALWPLLHPGQKRCTDCVGRSAHPRAATVGDLCDFHHERRQLDAKHAGSAA